MGQAKLRKETDPDYGRFSSRERGVIISNPIKARPDGFEIINSDLDPQDVRSLLMYWDKLAWPTGTLITPSGVDGEYLENCGVLLRPSFKSSGTPRELILAPQILAFENFEKKQPGMWCFGHGENSIIVDSGMAIPNQGSIIRLCNAIPVPSPEVPLNEILEFRRKRRPELLRLRAYFEELVQEIESSHDSESELNNKLKLVDSACADLVKTTREWQSPVKLSELKASINYDLTKAATGAVSAWSACETLELNLTGKCIAAASAAILSQFKIAQDIKFRSVRKPSSPYNYAYYVQRDLQ